MNIQKSFSIAAPLIVFGTILALVMTSNQEAQAKIWTIENCVMEKWQTWEDIRGVMPSSADEQIFRDECWNEMGASLN
jgi:hypothetical protein